MIPVPSEIRFTAALPAAASSGKRRSTAPEDLPTASSTPTHFRARPAEVAAELSQQRKFLLERRHSLPMISSIIRPASSYYYHASQGEQPLCCYPPGTDGVSVNFGSEPSSSLDASHEVALRNHQQLQRDRLRMDQQLQREEQTRITRHLHSPRRTSWPISSLSSEPPQDLSQEPRRRRREEHRVLSAADILSTADVRTLPRYLSSTDLRLEHSHHVESRKAQQDEESSPLPTAAKKKQKVSHHHEEEEKGRLIHKNKHSESNPEDSTDGDSTDGEDDVIAPSTRRSSSFSGNVTGPSTKRSSLSGNVTEPSPRRASFGGNVTEPSTRRYSWSGGNVPSRLTEEVTAAAARHRELLGLGGTFVLPPGREELGLLPMPAAPSDLTTTAALMASSLRLSSLDHRLRLLRAGLLTPDDEFGLASSTDVPLFARAGLSSSLLPTLPHSGLQAARRPSVWDNAILLSREQHILRRQALLRDATPPFLDPPLSALPLSVEEGLVAGRRSSLHASPTTGSGALLSSSTALPQVRMHDDGSPLLRQSSSCLLPTNATLQHPEGSSSPHARPSREVVDEGLRDKPSSSGGRDNRNIRSLPLHSALGETTVSEYQRLLRQQIELFEADEIEVQSNAQGRNKSIVLGQVGIRCKHCNHLTPKRRATGAVYFPKKLDRVYQTAQKMADKHLLKVCEFIPEETKAQMIQVKSHFKSCDGGGKQYWGTALASRGVEETETRGLVFSSSTTTTVPQQHRTARSSSTHHHHHHHHHR